MKINSKKESLSESLKEIVKAMGLVFGDIGTSPIYTLSIIFVFTSPTQENMMGILSLIFWSLIILVTVEYSWLAMSLSSKGEGGIIVLKEILNSKIKKGRNVVFITLLGYVGVSLLMGDGVITPAISILSAVEGLKLIPGIGHISTDTVIIITVVITILLFSFQSKGTDKVATLFGPIMIIWFGALFISGIYSIANSPEIFLAISPHYAIDFMLHNGIAGFFVLSEVILCATGGEALYADMGHLGSKPIRQAWVFVLIALVVNYFGQGAFVLHGGKQDQVLFEMVRHMSHFLYVPFLILTLLATIIASQAMISAVISLVYQGITTRIIPLMKIKYTSTKLKSQIYIGAVNWGLLIAVIFMIMFFRKSENLAAAYGMAVTATMTISSYFMIRIFLKDKNYSKYFFAIVVFIVDLIFLGAVLTKIPHGALWSIIIASLPFFVITLWTNGNKAMYKAFRSLTFDTFAFSYEQIYGLKNNIRGTALFFTKTLEHIPPYIVHCMIRGNIIYEKNVLVSIATSEHPYGIMVQKKESIASGLDGLLITAGYLEVLDIPKILKENEIGEKLIFYGVEDIETKKIYYKIFAFIKKITPPFVKFYKLPYNKIHGVVTKLEI